MESETVASKPPLGTSGSLRRRFLLHHVPLALASAVVLIAFMTVPLFDLREHPHGDIFSSAFPQVRTEAGSMDHGPDRNNSVRHGGEHVGAMRHGRNHGGPMDHGERDAAGRTARAEQMQHRSFARQFTVATGYVALGLLALTLLIGPAHLLLRRRNPVSNHLRRDAGTWTAIASVVHVIFGLQVHGGGRITEFLRYFVAADGSPLLNSFGLANWTGLGALVLVVGLLAISSDAALRKLKARPWKRFQRLNYPLFALVILHAFFYGALLRATSPYTVLLGLSVTAVVVAQAMGIWLWQRRYSRLPSR